MAIPNAPEQTSPSRRRLRHEESIASILTTAREIMRSEGAAALTMQELARRLGIRPPSLYNYFTGKMAIYDALFQLGFRLFDEEMHQPMDLEPASTTPELFLQTTMARYMHFAQQHPGFIPSPASMAVSLGILGKALARTEAWLQESGQTPDATLTTLQHFDLFNAVMHGLTALHLANEPHLPIGEGRFGSLIPAAVAMFSHFLQRPRP
jgi:AcrR family transcriptional regulator